MPAVAMEWLKSRPRAGAVTCGLWMLHSGGLYEVVKRPAASRRCPAPAELPAC